MAAPHLDVEIETRQAMPFQDAGQHRLRMTWFFQGMGLAALMLIGVVAMSDSPSGSAKPSAHDAAVAGWAGASLRTTRGGGLPQGSSSAVRGELPVMQVRTEAELQREFVAKAEFPITADALPQLNRRAFLASAAAAAPFLPAAAFAADAADDEAALIAEIKEIKAKLDIPKINALLDEEKWDEVRSIFKAPPVNTAFEQSQAKKNPFKKLADLRDDVEAFETVEELAGALQLADQYCYSNTFIYTQPGSGKVKIKEPKQQVAIAVNKLNSFLQ